jgi:hypothetical protein
MDVGDVLATLSLLLHLVPSLDRATVEGLVEWVPT